MSNRIDLDDRNVLSWRVPNETRSIGCNTGKEKTLGLVNQVQTTGSKSTFQARLWKSIFGNMNRTMDDLYGLCEEEEDVACCTEIVAYLTRYQKNFECLIEKIESQKLSATESQETISSMELNTSVEQHCNLDIVERPNECVTPINDPITAMNEHTVRHCTSTSEPIRSSEEAWDTDHEVIAASEKVWKEYEAIVDAHVAAEDNAWAALRCNTKMPASPPRKLSKNSDGEVKRILRTINFQRDSDTALDCTEGDLADLRRGWRQREGTILQQEKLEVSTQGIADSSDDVQSPSPSSSSLSAAKSLSAGIGDLTIDYFKKFSPSAASSPSASDSSPGVLVTPSQVSSTRSLHDKLSSPDRKRSFSPTMMKRRQEAAEHNRERTVAEIKQKAMVASCRVKLRGEREAHRLALAEQALDDKLKNAEIRHEEHIQTIKVKAGNENAKVSEIIFINNLNSEGLQEELQHKLEEVEARIVAAAQRRQERLTGISVQQKKRNSRKSQQMSALQLEIENTKMDRFMRLQSRLAAVQSRREERLARLAAAATSATVCAADQLSTSDAAATSAVSASDPAASVIVGAETTGVQALGLVTGSVEVVVMGTGVSAAAIASGEARQRKKNRPSRRRRKTRHQHDAASSNSDGEQEPKQDSIDAVISQFISETLQAQQSKRDAAIIHQLQARHRLCCANVLETNASTMEECMNSWRTASSKRVAAQARQGHIASLSGADSSALCTESNHCAQLLVHLFTRNNIVPESIYTIIRDLLKCTGSSGLNWKEILSGASSSIWMNKEENNYPKILDNYSSLINEAIWSETDPISSTGSNSPSSKLNRVSDVCIGSLNHDLTSTAIKKFISDGNLVLLRVMIGPEVGALRDSQSICSALQHSVAFGNLARGPTTSSPPAASLNKSTRIGQQLQQERIQDESFPLGVWDSLVWCIYACSQTDDGCRALVDTGVALCLVDIIHILMHDLLTSQRSIDNIHKENEMLSDQELTWIDESCRCLFKCSNGLSILLTALSSILSRDCYASITSAIESLRWFVFASGLMPAKATDALNMLSQSSLISNHALKFLSIDLIQCQRRMTREEIGPLQLFLYQSRMINKLACCSFQLSTSMSRSNFPSFRSDNNTTIALHQSPVHMLLSALCSMFRASSLFLSTSALLTTDVFVQQAAELTVRRHHHMRGKEMSALLRINECPQHVLRLLGCFVDYYQQAPRDCNDRKLTRQPMHLMALIDICVQCLYDLATCDISLIQQQRATADSLSCFGNFQELLALTFGISLQLMTSLATGRHDMTMKSCDRALTSLRNSTDSSHPQPQNQQLSDSPPRAPLRRSLTTSTSTSSSLLHHSLGFYSCGEAERCVANMLAVLGLCCLQCPDFQVVVSTPYTTLCQRVAGRGHAFCDPGTFQDLLISLSEAELSTAASKRCLLVDVCHLPTRYFSEDKYIQQLLPTLISMTVSCDLGLSIMREQLSFSLLSTFLKRIIREHEEELQCQRDRSNNEATAAGGSRLQSPTVAARASTRLALSAMSHRLPADLWQVALRVFSSGSPL